MKNCKRKEAVYIALIALTVFSIEIPDIAAIASVTAAAAN